MKAILLLSGGLDSTVCLASALAENRECYALAFDYGQRHKIELESAKKIAAHYQVPLNIIPISPEHFRSSSLVSGEAIPKNRTAEEMKQNGIPSTYVPARNTLFLAYAAGFAEMLEAEEIYFGCNALDLTGYPDCRPEFVKAFQNLLNVATRQSETGAAPKLVTPLLHLNKREIVALGKKLNAPIELTHSCYAPTESGEACLACDACLLREEAFT